MVDYLSEVLNVVGLEPKRIKMAFCSAAEGQKYQQTAIEFDKVIKEMGPNPFKTKAKEKQSEEKQPEESTEKQAEKKPEKKKKK